MDVRQLASATVLDTEKYSWDYIGLCFELKQAFLISCVDLCCLMPTEQKRHG